MRGFTMKLLLLSLVLFLLSACGVSSESAENEMNQKINVVATTTHVRDLAEQVGGEHVEVNSLMGPGVDPHEYQPSASDVHKLTQSDVTIYNGLHLEGMFSSVFEELNRIDKPTLELASGLDDGMILRSDEEDLEYDPHIWFSVENWKQSADYVAEFLGKHDLDHKDDYLNNARVYKEELDELNEYILSRVEEIPSDKRYLVTAHDAFQYFASDYDFEVIGIQGLNTQSEAGTRDISQLASFIADKKLNAVFVESSVSTRNIQALIEAVRSQGHTVELGGELYSDALGSPEDDTDTYIDMYRANIDTIVDGLK